MANNEAIPDYRNGLVICVAKAVWQGVAGLSLL